MKWLEINRNRVRIQALQKLRERILNQAIEGKRNLDISRQKIDIINRRIENLSAAGTPIESPIEAKMFQSLLTVLKPMLHECRIIPQYPVRGYRVDIAVIRDGTKIAIECDGHEFHEKTPEQAANDKRRERVLILEGFAVMRFTGREIMQNSDACAREVLTLMRKRGNVCF